jgi:hypothetical protein
MYAAKRSQQARLDAEAAYQQRVLSSPKYLGNISFSVFRGERGPMVRAVDQRGNKQVVIALPMGDLQTYSRLHKFGNLAGTAKVSEKAGQNDPTDVDSAKYSVIMSWPAQSEAAAIMKRFNDVNDEMMQMVAGPAYSNPPGWSDLGNMKREEGYSADKGVAYMEGMPHYKPPVWYKKATDDDMRDPRLADGIKKIGNQYNGKRVNTNIVYLEATTSLTSKKPNSSTREAPPGIQQLVGSPAPRARRPPPAARRPPPDARPPRST